MLEVLVLDKAPWRDKEWFVKEFIYNGKSIHELSCELGLNWSSVERWRQVHGLPKHSDKEKIIKQYGLEVWTNIMKKERYSASNRRNAEKIKGKSYEEIYGSNKATEIKNRISFANRGIKRSKVFRGNLSDRQKGHKNSNWKGGFYSGNAYKEIDRVYIKEYVLDTWNKYFIMEKNYTCESCGITTITCNGHHILSFTKIFEAVCFYLGKRNQLNTLSVIKEMHLFHKRNYRQIYKCLCPSCHRNIHKQQNYQVRVNEENQLIHLLTPYFSDPEPSLRRQEVAPFEEGAETIEITSE
ncbi:hypothetical protein B4113_2158 [Geobacillus sp. B4113_201601]|nr:hypothetical protein B4113_2158 [Geobacillus sp. B4113_201601]